eukprot:CAMPEP_0196995360 /NCGR_PEP_ID=MMETSP1380-20130617/1490_1 /TAXON_ID=5936 /ORGANISM="Euplotes crassus, Strain CT5" /LENGTH=68 /DNA_ID=CAMNT_0042411013 /DNA_START=404 /DNA_END=610 /DNA_ORIENTATION=-
MVKGAANPSIEMPRRKNSTDVTDTTKNPRDISTAPIIRTEFPLSLFITKFTRKIDQTGTTQGIANISP